MESRTIYYVYDRNGEYTTLMRIGKCNEKGQVVLNQVQKSIVGFVDKCEVGDVGVHDRALNSDGFHIDKLNDFYIDDYKSYNALERKIEEIKNTKRLESIREYELKNGKRVNGVVIRGEGHKYIMTLDGGKIKSGEYKEIGICNNNIDRERANSLIAIKSLYDRMQELSIQQDKIYNEMKRIKEEIREAESEYIKSNTRLSIMDMICRVNSEISNLRNGTRLSCEDIRIDGEEKVAYVQVSARNDVELYAKNHDFLYKEYNGRLVIDGSRGESINKYIKDKIDKGEYKIPFKNNYRVTKGIGIGERNTLYIEATKKYKVRCRSMTNNEILREIIGVISNDIL